MPLRVFFRAGSGQTIELTAQRTGVRYRRDITPVPELPCIPILNHEYDRLIKKHGLLRRHWGHGINVKRVMEARRYTRPSDEIVQAILAELRANPDTRGKLLAERYNVHPATISRYRSGLRRGKAGAETESE